MARLGSQCRRRDFENDYCGIFVIRDGKITTVREYLDSRYAANVLFSNSA